MKSSDILKRIFKGLYENFCFFVWLHLSYIENKNDVKNSYKLSRFFFKIEISLAIGGGGATPLEPHCILCHQVNMWTVGLACILREY